MHTNVLSSIQPMACLIFLSVGFILGCTSSTTHEHTPNDVYQLEIVDSLTVDYVGSLELLGVHASKDLFLFEGQEKGELVLTGRDGIIQQVFKKPLDSPDSFGPIVQGATFMGDTVVVFGITDMVMYDLEFNLLQKFRKHYPIRGMIYGGLDHLQVGKKGGSPILVVFTGGPQTDLPTNSSDYYKAYNTLDIVEPTTQSFDPIIPFHPRSRYASGTEAFNFIKPFFSVDNSLVSFVHQKDSLFYQYNLDSETFLVEKIPFEKFIMNSGFPIGGQEDYDSPQAWPGEITKLFQVGDKHVIAYRAGLTLDEMPGPEVSQENRIPTMYALNKEKLMVRNPGGIYSKPAILSDSYRLARTDKQGRIWGKQLVEALDYEPDLVTFYELKLVKKSN